MQDGRIQHDAEPAPQGVDPGPPDRRIRRRSTIAQGLPSLTFNLRHPGQFYDVESGMFYNLNRDYVPGAGRYTQSDPIGLAGGIDTYGYVGGESAEQRRPGWIANRNSHPWSSANSNRSDGSQGAVKDADSNTPQPAARCLVAWAKCRSVVLQSSRRLQ